MTAQKTYRRNMRPFRLRDYETADHMRTKLKQWQPTWNVDDYDYCTLERAYIKERDHILKSIANSYK